MGNGIGCESIPVEVAYRYTRIRDGKLMLALE